MERFTRTEENEKRIVEAYKRLKNYGAVAKEVGCCWNTVQRVMVKHGENLGQGNHTKGRRSGGSPMKITDEQILEAVRTMTRREIAEEYGIHVENLQRRMKRLGVHAVYQRKNSKTIDTHL